MKHLKKFNEKAASRKFVPYTKEQEDQLNFIEDCLIDLIDEKYKIKITLDSITIVVKTLEDFGKIENVVKQNKRRFKCILTSIDTIDKALIITADADIHFRLYFKYEIIP